MLIAFDWQMLNEPKKQADVLELMMLGVDVGFWEDVIKPAGDENLLPSTPDTPDLTIRLGNRLGTLTTPEGESGEIGEYLLSLFPSLLLCFFTSFLLLSICFRGRRCLMSRGNYKKLFLTEPLFRLTI
jgi:hypothetical protein